MVLLHLDLYLAPGPAWQQGHHSCDLDPLLLSKCFWWGLFPILMGYGCKMLNSSCISHLGAVMTSINDQAKIAWFTSTRGVYQWKLGKIVLTYFAFLTRSKETPLIHRIYQKQSPSLDLSAIFDWFKFLDDQGLLWLLVIGERRMWEVWMSKRPSNYSLIHFYKRCVSVKVRADLSNLLCISYEE